MKEACCLENDGVGVALTLPGPRKVGPFSLLRYQARLFSISIEFLLASGSNFSVYKDQSAQLYQGALTRVPTHFRFQDSPGLVSSYSFQEK